LGTASGVFLQPLQDRSEKMKLLAWFSAFAALLFLHGPPPVYGFEVKIGSSPHSKAELAEFVDRLTWANERTQEPLTLAVTTVNDQVDTLTALRAGQFDVGLIELSAFSDKEGDSHSIYAVALTQPLSFVFIGSD
jgi:hypothetical protein